MFSLVGDPVLWLSDFADEEDILGRSLWQEPSTTLIFLPEISERRHSGRRGKGRRYKRKGHDETEEESQQMDVPDESMQSEAQDNTQLWSQDFFDDLPLGARQFETTMPNLQPPQKKTKDGYSYLTYSYSSCATLDDNGRPVESTRRRYEDSSGALKALHRRRMGNRTMVTSWRKKDEQDEGQHDKQVSTGEVNEFEKEWNETTPFGAMEEHAMQSGMSSIDKSTSEGQVPDSPLPQEIP